jgi:hypothetical protein
MDRPAFRGFEMMSMMVDVVQGVHIDWQYTNGRVIWQGNYMSLRGGRHLRRTPTPLRFGDDVRALRCR